MLTKLSSVVLLFMYLRYVLSHGMMMEPPNRSSLWRFYNDSPTNYDDNQNYCGGKSVQWDLFGGKCGVCGDRWDEPHPQPNENTGLYGQGKLVGFYQSGSVIDVSILLTSNHLGNFQYSLCVLKEVTEPESGEDCFQTLTLGDGSSQYSVNEEEMEINHTIKLPDGLTCDRCVLRWHYTAGNTWGDCGNGTSAEGCGPQETFRSCSDIAII